MPLTIAPRQKNEDWRALLANPGERDHTVQLYSDLGFLTSAVSHYVGTALWKGEAVLLVVTPSHREAFTQRLQTQGINVQRRIDMGQLTILDAAETLSRFMVDGTPDRASFMPLIGGVIDLARVRGGYPRVRAYGEMVNLLWEKGQLGAALHLEELWNELGKTHAFSLHCAYAMDVFDPATHCCSAIAGVHHTHSHLIAAEHPSHLDKALRQALTDVLGPMEASSQPAQAVMLGLRDLAPTISEAILAQARHYYGTVAADLQ